MSNAVLEAMAHGLAIIGSRAAGTPEMLDEGAAGRLFDVGDWRALANHLYELATEPSERARLGAAAAARVGHVFRPERMVSETLYAYSDACRAHPAEAEFFLRKSEESVHGWRRPVELSITPVAP
jgi:glycosyltransferase involved in cell wall biosynthesis